MDVFGVLLLVASAVMPVQAAFKCSEGCIEGNFQDISKPFCEPRTWSICLEHQKVKDVDSQARNNFAAAIRMVGPMGLSAKCNATISAFECALMMPVCEAGSHGMKICAGEFSKVKEACEGVNETALGVLEENAAELMDVDSGSCVKLDYAGPSYTKWVIGFWLECYFLRAVSARPQSAKSIHQ